MKRYFKLATASVIVSLALAALSFGYAGVPRVVAHDNDDDDARVKLTFDQSLVVTHAFFGAVRGDIRGELTTEILTRSPVFGRTVRLESDWIVVANDHRSFIARLRGSFNTQTEEVEMEGAVTQGYLQGERVRATGRLVDLNTLRFRGKLLIGPRHGHHH
jgi:hypothetical protein